MDCCNYMQQRQSYYGSHYYENNPSYPPNDYHQHQYNNNTVGHHYNSSDWPFATSCSDYVYNPKEARIKKAMRDRERSMGAGQIATSRARRSPIWHKTPQPSPVHMGPVPSREYILGPHAKDLRSALRSEVQHGIFSGPSGNYVYPSHDYQFSPHADYTSYLHTTPPPIWFPNGYVQGNPMMRHQLWNQYQSDRLRHQPSPGPNYMMNPQEISSNYQQIEHNFQPMMTMPTPRLKQHQQQQQQQQQSKMLEQNIESTQSSSSFMSLSSDTCLPVDLTQHNLPESTSTVNNVNGVPTDLAHTVADVCEITDNTVNSSEMTIKNETSADSTICNDPVITTGSSQRSFDELGLYEEADQLTTFDPQELNKTLSVASLPPTSSSNHKNLNSLPDFNQAFGSTERGRFQSPPDPRIGPEKEYLDFFNTNLTIKTEQFSKWVETANSYNTSNFNNISF